MRTSDNCKDHRKDFIGMLFFFSTRRDVYHGTKASAQHRISIALENSRLVHSAFDRDGPSLSQFVWWEVGEMLNGKVHESATLKRHSPLALKATRDDSTPVWVNFRRLNTVAIISVHSLPRTGDSIDSPVDTTIFMTLDVTSSFRYIVNTQTH